MTDINFIEFHVGENKILAEYEVVGTLKSIADVGEYRLYLTERNQCIELRGSLSDEVDGHFVDAIEEMIREEKHP